VGTGAGLPGIPLLLARPQLQMVLLDSNGKKIRFLREVKRALGLNQLEIVEARVEDYHPPLGFDTVVSRAFSELGVFVALTEHLVNPHGHWLALKGRYPEDELVGLHYQTTVHEYDVPGVDGARCCVVLKKGD
jgi:16S rRNA (guanine527-N7)-methyltransferase